VIAAACLVATPTGGSRRDRSQRPPVHRAGRLGPLTWSLDVRFGPDAVDELLDQVLDVAECRCDSAYRLADSIARHCPLHGPEAPAAG
jgi:hypothetical protein